MGMDRAKRLYYSVDKVTWLGLLLIGAGILLASCRSVDDVYTDLVTNFGHERGVYQLLLGQRKVRGDQNLTTLKSWVSALSAVESELSTLHGKMAKLKGADLETAQKRVKDVQPQIEAIYDRYQQEQFILLIPRWSLQDAQHTLNRLTQVEANLRSAYHQLYNEFPRKTDFFKLSIQEDEGLKDTYNDCALLFEPYAVADQNCRKAAEQYCSHQTDLDCLKDFVIKSIPRFLDTGCSEKIGETWMTSAWVGQGIANCYSSNPILK